MFTTICNLILIRRYDQARLEVDTARIYCNRNQFIDEIHNMFHAAYSPIHFKWNLLQPGKDVLLVRGSDQD